MGKVATRTAAILALASGLAFSAGWGRDETPASRPTPSPTSAPVDRAQSESGPDAPAARRTFVGQTPLRVVRVDEPNAIIVLRDGFETRFRLAGIDRPDGIDGQRRCADFLRQLLLGELIHFESGTDATGDGVHLFRAPDGLFVNDELIRQGYAPANSDSATPYRSLFGAHERAARDARKGIWAAVPETKPGTSPPASAPAPSHGGGARESAPETRRAGREPKAGPTTAPTSAPSESDVCVTPNGTRYHTERCQHARGVNVKRITLAEARQRGLKPCSRCKPPQ